MILSILFRNRTVLYANALTCQPAFHMELIENTNKQSATISEIFFITM